MAVFVGTTINVGFFDRATHLESFRPFVWTGGGSYDGSDGGLSAYGPTNIGWLDNRWEDALREMGVVPNTLFGNYANTLNTQFERRLYWQLAGRQPLTPTSGITPFGIGSELELRMYHGNNYSWVISRLERAFNTLQPTNSVFRTTNFIIPTSNDPDTQQQRRTENSEYLDQLTNRELLNDRRKQVTTYNGARNDVMPSWLWSNFYAPQKKLDLRFAPLDLARNDRDERDIDRDGVIELNVNDPFDDDLNDDLAINELDYRIYLQDLVQRSFMYMNQFDGVNGVYQTYFGAVPETHTASPEDWFPVNATYGMAAAFTANLMEYRDGDFDLDPGTIDGPTIVDVRLPAFALNIDGVDDTPDPPRYMGMEKQPFLVEGFVGHLYRAYEVPDLSPSGEPWLNAGAKVIFHVKNRYEDWDNDCGLDEDGPDCVLADAYHGTVAAIQIANPFDEDIDFTNGGHVWELEFFGRRHRLVGLLPAATEEFVENPLAMPTPQPERRMTTAVIWAAPDAIQGVDVREEIKDFFDISTVVPTQDNGVPTDLQRGSFIRRAGEWETGNRYLYDRAVTIIADCNLNEIDDATEIAGDPNLDLDGDGILDSCNYENQESVIESRAIALYRDGILIDRFDRPDEQAFEEAVVELAADRPPCLYSWEFPNNDPAQEPERQPICDPLLHQTWTGDNTNFLVFPGDEITPNDAVLQWVRVTRAWGFDVDGDGFYEDDERSPRYVFGEKAVIVAEPINALDQTVYPGGNAFLLADDPDTDWFARRYVDAQGIDVTDRKPVFFGFDPAPSDTPERFYPDKGWYGQEQGVDVSVRDPDTFRPIEGRTEPFQMLLKNRDFDQVGEVLNVFMFGHGLDASNQTLITFSEFLEGVDYNGVEAEVMRELVGTGAGANRLRSAPTEIALDLDETLPNTGDPIVDDDGDPLTFDPEIFHTVGGLVGYFTAAEIARLLPANGPGPQDYSALAGSRRAAIPALPSAVRLLDAMVCDGKGQLRDFDDDGVVIVDADLDGTYEIFDPEDFAVWEQQRYYNAGGFTRTMTTGMINANTAPVEVLRSMPHWYRAIHEETGFVGANPLWSTARNPYPRMADSLIRYRERQGALFDLTDPGAAYLDRGDYVNANGNFVTIAPYTYQNSEPYMPGLRSDRGVASPHEALLLTRGGKYGKDVFTDPVDPALPDDPFLAYNGLTLGMDPLAAIDSIVANASWQAGFLALPELRTLLQDELTAPESNWDLANSIVLTNVNEVIDETTPYYVGDPQIGSDPFNRRWARKTADLSTDVVNRIDGGFLASDATAFDAEEENLLHAGASNLLSSRSDVFTVYFKIRSFRANPVTGVWNALDREQIVDDSRYVMLIDRSEVDAPTDEPRILYLEKLPN